MSASAYAAGETPRLHAIAGPDTIVRKESPAEVIADGIVHAVGVCLGLVAVIALMTVAVVCTTLMTILAVSIYVWGLLSMLLLSASYNLWPASPTKCLLLRFDQSAIYLLIAATYTPFVLNLGNHAADWFLAAVWSAAALGILARFAWPDQFYRTCLALYLAMGWSGVAFYRPEARVQPRMVLWLVLAGGTICTIGLIFHYWERLRFQRAIWHCFVLVAVACHYAAVLKLVLG